MTLLHATEIVAIDYDDSTSEDSLVGLHKTVIEMESDDLYDHIRENCLAARYLCRDEILRRRGSLRFFGIEGATPSPDSILQRALEEDDWLYLEAVERGVFMASNTDYQVDAHRHVRILRDFLEYMSELN